MVTGGKSATIPECDDTSRRQQVNQTKPQTTTTSADCLRLGQ